jgi:hypothetical protein
MIFKSEFRGNTSSGRIKCKEFIAIEAILFARTIYSAHMNKFHTLTRKNILKMPSNSLKKTITQKFS